MCPQPVSINAIHYVFHALLGERFSMGGLESPYVEALSDAP
jgi:hypothetical protein